MKFILSTVFLFCLFSCSDNESINSQHRDTSAFTVKVIATKNKAFEHKQIFTKAHKISEPLGSGVASIDIDNDGTYELFFAQFDEYHSKSVLYQRQSQQYIDITNQVGLNNLTAIIGVATADINNDGWVDLLVYGVKRLHLMLNNNGHFSELKLPELDGNSFFTSATFFNANNDEYLDMWLSRYVEMKPENSVQCLASDGSITYCAPSALPAQRDYLLLNHGGEFFSRAPLDNI
ncbi:MAG TPA: VCBS repeat-containing protein, partial [Oceanospirillales bacterium]|nr:VCBS repeat-containing protein [Oceanospirillales bacterium]